MSDLLFALTEQQNVWSFQTDERVIWRSSMVRLAYFLLDWRVQSSWLTELRIQEDPMATLEIPESATTQTITGG
jgi:hypothetical protein